MNSKSNDESEKLVRDIQEVRTCLDLQQHVTLGQAQQTNSSIIRLPTEILSKISLEVFCEGDTSESWSSGETPLLLGSICRRWRDVVWTTPQLWRTIHLEAPMGRYRASHSHLLEEWLLRSRLLPLSIFLKFGKPAGREGGRHVLRMWQIMDVVARCSERWQHVHLDIPFFFDEDNCFVPKEFPQLLSLSIDPELASVAGFDIFQRAPILSDVSLLEEYKITHRTLLPTRSLRCLTVEQIESPECLQILKRHRNLVQCAFKSVAVDAPSLWHAPEFVTAAALSLVSLEINFTTGNMTEGIRLFLECLSTPALRNLAVHVESAARTFPHTHLILLILRSSCSIVWLDLFKIGISDEQLVELLSATSSLEDLRLREMGIGAHVIDKLTMIASNGDFFTDLLLPKLVSLSMVINRRVLFDFVDLAKMVASRRRGTAGELNSSVAQMDSISVHVIPYGKGCSGLPTAVALARFQELEDDGMNVHLKISDDY